MPYDPRPPRSPSPFDDTALRLGQRRQEEDERLYGPVWEDDDGPFRPAAESPGPGLYHRELPDPWSGEPPRIPARLMRKFTESAAPQEVLRRTRPMNLDDPSVESADAWLDSRAVDDLLWRLNEYRALPPPPKPDFL